MGTRGVGRGPPAWLAVFLVAAAFLALLPAVARGATLVVTPSGLGQVTSDPAGISCPPTCTASFDDGITATLSETPATNYVFGIPDDQGGPVDQTGWNGCDPLEADPTRCTVVLPGDESRVTASFRPASLLLLVANGVGSSVTATISDPKPGETAVQTCSSDIEGGVVCPFAYLPGRFVTLTPSPLGSPPGWPEWSDDNCIDGSGCTVVMDEDRVSVTATFATQHVFVWVSGPGTVSSDPPGISSCAESENACGADFPANSEVTLTATGDTPKWTTDSTDPTRAACDSVSGASNEVCHLTVERTRWAVVTFAGADAKTQYPPAVGVRFSIRKQGSGAVRGGPIDCGGRCSAELKFGNRYVMTADPSNGWRFVRWRGGCGTNPRCSVTVGPTSRMTAVFAASAGSSGVDQTQTNQVTQQLPKLQPALARITVKKKGGRYSIVLPLRLNIAATVNARLTTSRKRLVAKKTWKLKAGSQKLTLRARTKPGRYRLALKISSADGQTKSLTRTLRLR
jgi:Divergent InlB B-repeat domain